MQKKIKSIIDLLAYKPANIEDFELLEDAGEKPHSSGQIRQKGLNDMRNSVSMSVADNLNKLRAEFNLPLNEDIYIREFRISEDTGAAIAFVEGMVDRLMINDFILRPIMTSESLASLEEGCTIDFIFNYILSVSRVRKVNNMNDIITDMLKGFTVLFVDGCSDCLLIDCKGYEKRSVEKPATETVIYDP